MVGATPHVPFVVANITRLHLTVALADLNACFFFQGGSKALGLTGSVRDHAAFPISQLACILPFDQGESRKERNGRLEAKVHEAY